MVRTFIVFLMLLVVFLAGILLGVERGQFASSSDPEKEAVLQEDNMDEQTVEDRQIEEKEIEEENYLTDPDGKTHLMQKTASFLETGVSGFYDVIVQMLYQFSSLFF